MNDQLRPLLGRLIGVIAPVILIKLFNAIGVPMPAELPGLVTDICVVLLLYSITHRLTDRSINPGDAASPATAKIELAEKKQRNDETDG